MVIRDETMNEQDDDRSVPEWRFLWELKIAAQSVSEVYVSLSLLAGHYVRVSSKDFLGAINDMQEMGAVHAHPRRFRFTTEKGILWVHASMMPPAASSSPPPAEAS